MTSRISRRKSSDEIFRLALESSPCGFVMFNTTGKILFANSQAERLFQYGGEELVGRPVDILVPQRFRGSGVRRKTSLLNGRRAAPFGSSGEFVGLRKNGTEFPIEIAINAIATRDSGPVNLAAVNDLSERKTHDQMKDEFVAMASHELRTPLTSIAASLGLLIADPAGTMSEPAMRLLKIAHSNSLRLVRLINDILDIEKIESGQIEFNMRDIDVGATVEQAILANRGFADQYSVQIRLDTVPRNAIVTADADRLTQVVTNLLSNAVKYSPTGDEVRVTVSNIGTFVRIAVRDHGPGIPEKFKPRIFQRFAQADSTEARNKGGTGLGLSIVKQLMLRFGGEAGFAPAPGGGTVFYVDLPRIDSKSTVKRDDADDEKMQVVA